MQTTAEKKLHPMHCLHSRDRMHTLVGEMIDAEGHAGCRVDAETNTVHVGDRSISKFFEFTNFVRADLGLVDAEASLAQRLLANRDRDYVRPYEDVLDWAVISAARNTVAQPGDRRDIPLIGGLDGMADAL